MVIAKKQSEAPWQVPKVSAFAHSPAPLAAKEPAPHSSYTASLKPSAAPLPPPAASFTPAASPPPLFNISLLPLPTGYPGPIATARLPAEDSMAGLGAAETVHPDVQLSQQPDVQLSQLPDGTSEALGSAGGDEAAASPDLLLSTQPDVQSADSALPTQIGEPAETPPQTALEPALAAQEAAAPLSTAQASNIVDAATAEEAGRD